MEDRTLVIGGFYRHFKNKLYQVRAIATHSETREKMVVYQALYGDYSTYVRPYDMFISEVDHVKYPEVTQKYRFEQVNPDGSSLNKQRNQMDGQVQTETASVIQPEESQQVANVQQTELVEQTEAVRRANVVQQAEKVQQTDEVPVKEEEAEGEVDPGLLLFLDAETYHDKLNTLSLLQSRLTDNLINAMAASMEVEVKDGPIEERYQSLRRCIQVRAKYECTRLR